MEQHSEELDNTRMLMCQLRTQARRMLDQIMPDFWTCHPAPGIEQFHRGEGLEMLCEASCEVGAWGRLVAGHAR
eukprot:839451-Pelagomonas_calceolata.AAC.5